MEARKLVAEKKYAEAIAILDKLSAERPREPQARFLKGLALADSGKPDEAIVVFQAVLGEYPELPEPHNNLAVLYAQKGEYGLARDELEAAISAAPDYAVAYENLGDIYARLAAVNYEKASARDAANKSAPAKLKMVREVLAPPRPHRAARRRPCSGGGRAGRRFHRTVAVPPARRASGSVRRFLQGGRTCSAVSSWPPRSPLRHCRRWPPIRRSSSTPPRA